MQLRFNRHDRTSPVIICLHDIVYRQGALQRENEIVARVNMLAFRHQSGTPKMEVTLASVKSKDAADSLGKILSAELRAW